MEIYTCILVVPNLDGWIRFTLLKTIAIKVAINQSSGFDFIMPKMCLILWLCMLLCGKYSSYCPIKGFAYNEYQYCV